MFVAASSEALAATRTPISRDQASDNILLCKAGGGEIVRTPSVVACCNEQSDGTTICVGCAPDGSHCANYAVRTGPKGSLRRSLTARAAAGHGDDPGGDDLQEVGAAHQLAAALLGEAGLLLPRRVLIL
jgi:hypothetical protein